MKKEKVKQKPVRAHKEIIDGEVFYTCTKCGKQLPIICFYGRNRACKNCYNPSRKKEKGIWHCKYCGETNENKRFRNYLFCVNCVSRHLPKGVTKWKCVDCGTEDTTKRVGIQMICTTCNCNRVKARNLLLKPIREAEKAKKSQEKELAQRVRRMLENGIS